MNPVIIAIPFVLLIIPLGIVYFSSIVRRLIDFIVFVLHLAPPYWNAKTEWGDQMIVVMTGGFPVWWHGHLDDYEYSLHKFIEKHVKQGDVFVDGGAHAGYFSVLAHHLGAFVHAFEPTPATYSILVANNMGRHMKTYNAALDNHTDGVRIYDNGWRGGGANSHAKFYKSTKTFLAPTTRLDKIITKADFVKLDVEGMEYDALVGATQILDQSSPIVATEALTQEDAHRVRDFMVDHGYTAYQLVENGKVDSYVSKVPRSGMLIFSKNKELVV